MQEEPNTPRTGGKDLLLALAAAGGAGALVYFGWPLLFYLLAGKSIAYYRSPGSARSQHLQLFLCGFCFVYLGCAVASRRHARWIAPVLGLAITAFGGALLLRDSGSGSRIVALAASSLPTAFLIASGRLRVGRRPRRVTS